MENIKKPKFHYGYVIVACCCLIMGIDVGLVMSCAGIFYKPVSEELNVAVGEFGLYMSFNFLTSALMLSIAGKMLEKWSARKILAISSGVLGMCFFAMGFFNSVWQFYLVGCIMGVTQSFLLYLSFPTMINRWFKSGVGFFIGICSAASGIGGMLFNPIGALWITDLGWRATYWIFGGIVFFIVSPLIWLLLRDYPHQKGLLPFGSDEKATTAKGAEDGVEYSKAIKMPVFYALVVFAFIMMAVSTLNLFIPNYMTDLSFSLEQAALVAAAVMAGVTVGKVVLGIINDRNNLLGVMVTVVGGVLGLAIFVWAHFNVYAVIVAGFLFGWEYAGVTVQTAMLVRAVFGNVNYARIFSNISMALAAGGAIMSGGWGILADATSFSFIFILGAGALSLCGFIGIYALRKRYNRNTSIAALNP